MSDIFISYARTDRARAKILAVALERRGWSVWWDRRIPPGKTFDEVIEEALDAAKCIIVLWSKESMKADWVKKEALEGLRRQILVAVVIDEVKIPIGFLRIQSARLVHWQDASLYPDFDQLSEAVTAILGRPMSPETPKPKSLIIRDPIVRLRSRPRRKLSEDDVKIMLVEKDFYAVDWNKKGKGLKHKFESIEPDGMKIVIDQTTGLSWQQSGSEDAMPFKGARDYVAELNQMNFGGYSDWRLPTLEEAMSLMESKIKHGDLFIEPVFDLKQNAVWTSDRESASRTWGVDFYNGYCGYYRVDFSLYVRAVRSGI